MRTKMIYHLAISVIITSFLPSAANAASCDRATVDTATKPIAEQSASRMDKAQKMVAYQGQPDILLIGDSIAARWKKDQGRDFDGLSVANMGLGGERIQELRWRLKHLAPKVDPKRVLLIIGTNNLRVKSIATCAVFAGIYAAVNDVKALWPDAKLFVMPILPRGKGFRYRQQDRMEINQNLSTLNNVTFVKVDEDALTCGWAKACQNYLTDNVHLAGSGYAILRDGLDRSGF